MTHKRQDVAIEIHPAKALIVVHEDTKMACLRVLSVKKKYHSVCKVAISQIGVISPQLSRHNLYSLLQREDDHREHSCRSLAMK